MFDITQISTIVAAGVLIGVVYYSLLYFGHEESEQAKANRPGNEAVFGFWQRARVV